MEENCLWAVFRQILTNMVNPLSCVALLFQALDEAKEFVLNLIVELVYFMKLIFILSPIVRVNVSDREASAI